MRKRLADLGCRPALTQMSSSLRTKPGRTKEAIAMTQVLKNLFLFLLIAASAAAQPTITSISPTTAPRSGRVLIQGTGFGTVQGSGHVTVAGISAPLTRWSDTLIAAYVPESTLIGGVNVQVFNSQGAASNLVPITVTSRPPQTGHIRWRFRADGDYIPTRPAVGSDGTVYAQDVYGHLYAVDSSGGLKWISMLQVTVSGTSASARMGPSTSAAQLASLHSLRTALSSGSSIRIRAPSSCSVLT